MSFSTSTNSLNGEEVPGKNFICVAMLHSGKTVKTEAESPGDCCNLLNEASIVWMDYSAKDIEAEVGHIAQLLGFSDHLVSSLMEGYKSSYEDYTTEMGLKLPAIKVDKLDVTISPLLVLIRKNLVFTIHSTAVKRLVAFTRYAETFMKKIPTDTLSADQITMILSRIIDENNGANFDHLRTIEEQGDEMSKRLMDPTTPRAMLGPDIYKMKHSLITYLNGLWATVDVINTLRYGDAELLTDEPKLLTKIGALAEDVNRQIGLGEHMSDVLASGLEVLQTIYNNQLQVLNNRMALVITYLTILGTAVLVPNTLATIFSNSAFNLGPQDALWYSLLLIFSTIISTWAAYYWIRKKHWLPPKID